MANCNYCNALLEEGGLFCPGCGAKAEEPVVAPQPVNSSCPNCGQTADPAAAFCPLCGTALAGQPQIAPVAYEAPVAPVEAAVLPETAVPANAVISPAKKKKLLIMFIAAAAAAAVGITTLILNPFGSSGALPSVAYVKDGNMHFTFLDDIAPFELTENLLENNESSLSALGNQLYFMMKYSENGRYLLYPDRITKSDGMTLYYRDLKSNAPALKIDTDVSNNVLSATYGISADGKRVIYRKGEDNIVYIHNLIAKEKIDSDVKNFHYDKDIGKVVYEKNDAIYVKDLFAVTEKVKIASDAKIVGYSDDLSVIYYLKDGSLYVKSGDKDGVKIASDVDRLQAKYDDGSLYYIKKNETEVTLWDYVTDDVKDSDANMTEPDITDFQTEDPDSEWGGVTTDYDAYYAARDKYREKENRDSLRENLKKESAALSGDALYYHNGGTETLIADGVGLLQDSAADKPVVVYKQNEKGDIPKVKLSEVDSVYDVRSAIESVQTSSTKLFIAFKEKAVVVSPEKINNARLNHSATKLYFTTNQSDDISGTLMEAALGADTVSAPVKVDDDVNLLGFLPQSDEYYYIKNHKDDKGDLYQNKKLLTSDIMLWSIFLPAGSSRLVYLADYSAKSRLGTLYAAESSQAVKIADDVFSYAVASNGDIVYLYDYSPSRQKGDLFVYSGSGAPVRIDTDISAIIGLNHNYFATEVVVSGDSD